MSDVVERARRDACYSATHGALMRELADEIERLQAVEASAIRIGFETENTLRAEIERLQALEKQYLGVIKQHFAEIERLQADKSAISDTAAHYLHEIERLRKLEQWARTPITDVDKPLEPMP